MPISKDEWNAGRKLETPESRVLLFLRNKREQAFTLGEIARGIGYATEWQDVWGFIGTVANLWEVQNAVSMLIKEGTVKAKVVKKAIGEDTYYMAV